MADDFVPYGPGIDPKAKPGINPRNATPGDVTGPLAPVFNLPGSVVKQGAGVLQAAAGLVPRPKIDAQGIHTSVPTLEALGHVLAGLYGKATGEDVSPESAAAANALISHYNKTYVPKRFGGGGMEGFWNTFSKDPASVLSDIASIAAPVEGGVKMAGQLAKGTSLAGSVPMLTRAGEMADAVSDVTNPLKMARTATKSPRRALADHIYGMSLRTTPRHGEDFRAPAIEAGIKSGVVGGRRLDQSIDAAMEAPQAEVDKGINYYQNAGLKVDLGDVARKNVGIRPATSQSLGRPHTQAEIQSSGPVYGSYTGTGMDAQHDAIDKTLADAAKSAGYPGQPPTPPGNVINPATGQPFNPGSPGIPPTLGPIDFDRANNLAKKTYRDVERATKSSEFSDRTAPAIDTNKAIAAGTRRDMKEQADAARAANPNAPDISTPLKTQSNLMALKDMMDPSNVDLHAAERTVGMGGLYAASRAAMQPAVKTRAALTIAPESPTFNRPIATIGGTPMPTWSQVGDVGAKAGATFNPVVQANHPQIDTSISPTSAPNVRQLMAPQQHDDFTPAAPQDFTPAPVANIPKMADGGMVTGPSTMPKPGPYKAGDARKIKGVSYVRDEGGMWHPQPAGQ